MGLLKALIVEDEENSRLLLKNMLEKYCEGIEVTGAVTTVDAAVQIINKNFPDVVFLDIELPNKNGFELLDLYPSGKFEIVFTTAYDKYALKAFKLSATDYLLKPIDLEELRASLFRVLDKKSMETARQKIQVLKENLNNKLHKLALPTGDGFFYSELAEVIRCEAMGNYTVFYIVGLKEKLLVSRSLKFYEDILDGFNFLRINRKDLINLNHIKKFTKQKKSKIEMSDGSELELAEARKDAFMEKFEDF